MATLPLDCTARTPLEGHTEVDFEDDPRASWPETLQCFCWHERSAEGDSSRADGIALWVVCPLLDRSVVSWGLFFVLSYREVFSSFCRIVRSLQVICQKKRLFATANSRFNLEVLNFFVPVYEWHERIKTITLLWQHLCLCDLNLCWVLLFLSTFSRVSPMIDSWREHLTKWKFL